MKRLAVSLFLLALSASLSGQMTWFCATDSAEWRPKRSHAAVAFDNKIWVMGGLRGMPNITYWLNDVWYSSDGVNWTCATESAEWQGRAHHASVVFDNKLWVMGGYYLDTLENWVIFYDVWCSADGRTWTRVIDSAPWSSLDLYRPTAVVFDNQIWLISGTQIWNTPDGIHWFLVTDSAGWFLRDAHTAVVFDNKIWIMGGWAYLGRYVVYNDVWYSSDGVNWTCATESSEWQGRAHHASAVFDNKLWVMGGSDSVFSEKNDVWYSPDGTNWFCATDSAEWWLRDRHASVVFDNKLWVLGGFSRESHHHVSRDANDVWYSTGLPGIEEESAIIRPQVAGTTILADISHLLIHQPSILLDPTGRQVAILKPGTNHIRHLKPGIYFLRTQNYAEQTQTNAERVQKNIKLVLIE